MERSSKLGTEHCNFRFHFAGEKTYKDTTLKLIGFPEDMISGWKVQLLRIPPVVSEQCNVI